MQLAEGLMWKRHTDQLRARTSSGSTDSFSQIDNALGRSKLKKGRSVALEDIVKECC